jgi:hypothetical protein
VETSAFWKFTIAGMLHRVNFKKADWSLAWPEVERADFHQQISQIGNYLPNARKLVSSQDAMGLQQASRSLH